MSNPLADAIGEPTDEQLRRVVALMGLRQLPEDNHQPKHKVRADEAVAAQKAETEAA